MVLVFNFLNVIWNFLLFFLKGIFDTQQKILFFFFILSFRHLPSPLPSKRARDSSSSLLSLFLCCCCSFFLYNNWIWKDCISLVVGVCVCVLLSFIRNMHWREREREREKNTLTKNENKNAKNTRNFFFLLFYVRINHFLI